MGEAQNEICRKQRRGRGTLWTWLKDPTFRARVDELRDILTERTLGVLASATARAVLTLDELLDKELAPGTRRRAADSLLSHSEKHREAHDLQRQLQAIQEQLSALENARRTPR